MSGGEVVECRRSVRMGSMGGVKEVIGIYAGGGGRGHQIGEV